MSAPAAPQAPEAPPVTAWVEVQATRPGGFRLEARIEVHPLAARDLAYIAAFTPGVSHVTIIHPDGSPEPIKAPDLEAF